jgi:hypothetical protein
MLDQMLFVGRREIGLRSAHQEPDMAHPHAEHRIPGVYIVGLA